jgi:amino acid transporter
MTTELDRVEAEIDRRSAEFKKELGLRDLVLTQILFIVGLGWIGTAARVGPSHVVFWLLAIVFFYIPSALVVIHLNRLMPLEGGLYQWAKVGFSELAGFLVAWNIWIYAIVNASEIGLQVTTYLSYALGPEARWIASHKPLILAAACAVVTGLVSVSIRGLAVGKWVHNAGGALMVVLFGTLVALPVANYFMGTLPRVQPFSLALPAFTMLNLNLFGKMGFAALGGFEYVAIVAGECRDPARSIGRSVLIAAPIVAAMFILGTAAVLCFVPPEQVDLIGPIAQVLDVGSRPLGFASAIAPVVIMAITIVRVAQASVNFTGSTRLPMVAGWDSLLPQWFVRLHRHYHTPVNSILFVGAVTLSFAIAVVIGVGEQEAFQLLNNASGIFYALTYLVMFALPIAGFRRTRSQAPIWLKAAAASGFLMTALYVALSIFPIVPVGNVALFTTKITLVVLGTNAAGAALFVASKRRRLAPVSAMMS